MRKFFLTLTIFTVAGACLVPLRNQATRLERQFRADQNLWQTRNQQVTDAQAEHSALTTKIGESKRSLREIASSMDPALMDFLLADDGRTAPPDMQEKILAAFGKSAISTRDYVLVSKAALAKAVLTPLETLPNGEKLTGAARGVLAITPDEQGTVEAAFAEELGTVAAWAKANVKREGPSEDMLVRYTIPADPAFEQSLTSTLFSKINAAIGDERGELMRRFFDANRIREDGAIGDRTNIFSLHRITEPPGIGSRSGWKWENSEAINTYPEPIKPNRFPYAFRFVFPGGWPQVAQQEGIELPVEFNK